MPIDILLLHSTGMRRVADWRPERVDGRADVSTRRRLAAVSQAALRLPPRALG